MSALLLMSEAGNATRFKFNSPMTALPGILSAFTYTRSSNKTVLQNGRLVTLSANQFGTSYDPVTGLYGYLPETAATNLLLYSNDFSNVAWGKNNSTITPNSTTSPDGSNNASLLTCSANNGYVTQGFTSSAAIYTHAVYVKKGNTRYCQISIYDGVSTHTYIFDFDNNCALTGTLASPEGYLAENIGNGWFRISIRKTLTAGAGRYATIWPSTSPTSSVQSNGDTLYIYGAQLETGSYASTYIPTTSATATRAADVLTVPLANIAGFVQSEYTLFADCRSPYVGGGSVAQVAMAVRDATSTNTAYIYMLDDVGQPVGLVRSGGVNQSIQVGSISGVSRYKHALSVISNSSKYSKNGTASAEDTTVTMPISPTTLSIGVEVSSGHFNGYIYSSALYTRALSQAQINGLTS